MKNLLTLKNFGYLIIILLPAYLIRFSVFGIPTNALEILTGIFFISVLVDETYRNNLKMIFSENKKHRLLVSIVIIGLLSSALASQNPMVGLGVIKGWVIVPIILVLGLFLIVKEKERINLWRAYFFSSSIVSIISLGYLFFGHTTYDGRISGIFNSPNYLAMYLAPGIIAGALLALNQKSKIKNDNLKLKIILWTLVIFSLAALYFTYSYAAWVSLAISLSILFITNKKISNKPILILAIIVVVGFFFQLDKTKFYDLININPRSSLSSRAMIWRAAWDIGKDNWLLGIGPGNFQSKYLEYQKYYPPYLEWAVPHPHSLYLTFWLYGGVAGLVGWLGILVVFFLNIVRKIKVDEKNKRYLSIALGVMIYIIIHGLVDTTIFKNDLAVIFWLSYLSVL